MPITRTFLDWSRPALPALADHLLNGYEPQATVDLSNLLMVVPGGRAGRRLQELLVDKAEERQLILVPPEIDTPALFPEKLYTAQKPFADDLTQELAWIHSLQSFDRDRLQPYFPNLPEDTKFTSWKPFAEILSKLHRELAADNLDFSDVATKGGQLDNFPEVERWRVLYSIQEEYLRTLDELEVWDKQTARLVAIKQRECETDRRIVLVGTVDMNQAIRQMIDQVADRVESVIFAPQSFSQRFDEHGCLKPNAWPNVMSPIEDEQIRIVSRPGNQADEVLRALAELEGSYPGEEIVIGVPDKSLVPVIEQRLESARLESRYGVGRTVGQTLIARFFLQLAEWLEEGTVVAFQNLLRHPAVERYLQSPKLSGDWLTELDRYRCQHLPLKLSQNWLGKRVNYALIKEILDKLTEVFSDWQRSSRPLPEWCPLLIAVCSQFFDVEDFSAAEHRERKPVFDAIRSALEKFSDVPSELTPTVNGSEFLHLLHGEIANTEIPPETNLEAIELLGWLELPWDDTDVLIVTGLNEGLVPSSQNGDLFLPNRLRQVLELEDNQRRAARDAYALSLITASRQKLTLIAGQMNATNDPLVPSRFLFGETPERIVSRTLQFFEEGSAPSSPVPGRLEPGLTQARFQPPQFEEFPATVTSMRVTEFRDYIQCPYRYFLKHQLKLKSVIPQAEELDGGAFGSVLHAVLENFGQDESLRDVTDVGRLTSFLNAELNRKIAEDYGKNPEPAIRIQTERMRARLKKFAEWQAGWVETGWRIEHVEEEVRREHEAEFDVDGTPILLRGRIDRIDVNRSTGEIMVFDYKTSDSAKTPEKTHYKPRQQEWVDLQLPLYRHLVKSLGIDTEVGLAYINLPKKLDDVKHAQAGWNAELLLSADEKAREIVRSIRENIFWPPSDDGGLMSEFAEICLETMISEEDDEEGGSS